MEEIRDEAAFRSALQEALTRQDGHAVCLLSRSFAARRTDDEWRRLADLLLPRAQTRRYHLCRNRDGTLRFGVTATLREGIRMAAAARAGETSRLSLEARAALEIAQSALDAIPPKATEEETFRLLFRWLALHAEYEHHRPGTANCASVVCAEGALLRRRANCQGFADAYWLLCTLAGLTAEVQPGYSGRGTHLWNLICLDGQWYAADASRASRLYREAGEEAMWQTFRMDRSACEGLGLRWEPVMEVQQI